MAPPIGMKACLISLVSPYSVENGASNRTAGVFKVYSLLKLALVFPFSAENGASNRSKQSLELFCVMFTILLH
jgi:hypothetical protein